MKKLIINAIVIVHLIVLVIFAVRGCSSVVSSINDGVAEKRASAENDVTLEEDEEEISDDNDIDSLYADLDLDDVEEVDDNVEDEEPSVEEETTTSTEDFEEFEDFFNDNWEKV